MAGVDATEEGLQTAADPLAEVRSRWQPEPGRLNTASYGLPPTPAWDALQDALDVWRAL